MNFSKYYPGAVDLIQSKFRPMLYFVTCLTLGLPFNALGVGFEGLPADIPINTVIFQSEIDTGKIKMNATNDAVTFELCNEELSECKDMLKGRKIPLRIALRKTSRYMTGATLGGALGAGVVAVFAFPDQPAGMALACFVGGALAGVGQALGTQSERYCKEGLEAIKLRNSTGTFVVNMQMITIQRLNAFIETRFR